MTSGKSFLEPQECHAPNRNMTTLCPNPSALPLQLMRLAGAAAHQKCHQAVPFEDNQLLVTWMDQADLSVQDKAKVLR
jgi:hypothetical protein